MSIGSIGIAGLDNWNFAFIVFFGVIVIGIYNKEYIMAIIN